MSSLKTRILSPIVTEETHEFTWTLPDHNAVVYNADSLSRAARDFSFTSTDGITYKWQLGNKPVDKQKLTPYLRFLSPGGKASDVIPKRWLLYERSESLAQDGWMFSTGVEPKTFKSISEYQDKTLTTPATWNLNDSTLKSDGQGTRIWKSELVVHIRNESTALANLNAAALARQQQDFAMILENGYRADLKIVCSDGVELKAHKLIISHKNSVFTAMLTANMVEVNTGVVEVKDISSVIMKLLLHFLYTGVLKEEWRQPENIVEFTYAAGKYQFNGILKFLDASLGTFDHGKSNLVPLMNLVRKLELKKAENELLQRAKETVKKTETVNEFFRIMKSWGELIKEL